MTRQIRNIAIIAHVDHGKTTLVDQLLRQSGTFRDNEKVAERVMDSNDLETRARHHDPGEELRRRVEGHAHQHRRHARPRRLRRRGRARAVDGRQRAAAGRRGRRPDAADPLRHQEGAGARPEADRRRQQGRPARRARRTTSINATFDLFDKLGATEEQLDFPVIYASGLNGWATLEQGEVGTDLAPLFDAILEHVPAHEGEPGRPAAAADLLARLLHLRRPHRHRPRQPGHAQADAGRRGLQRARTATPIKARVNQVLKFEGLERQQATEAGPGDIVLINGIEGIGIGVTLTDLERPAAAADAAGRRADADDELLRQQLAAGRPRRQVRHQPADPRPPRPRAAVATSRCKVKDTDEDGIFEVSGRGELHLTILLENMRREGYELAVLEAARRLPRGGRRAPRADRAGHRRRRGPAPGRA